MSLAVRVSRYSGEEPPHPAHLHAALRASGCRTDHDQILRWWEQLPPPRIHRVGRDVDAGEGLVFVWPEAEPTADQRDSVRDLVSRVSDRAASVWRGLSVVDRAPSDEVARYVPEDGPGDVKLCVAAPGFTDALAAGREHGQEWDQVAEVRTYRADRAQVLSGHGKMLCFRFPRGVAVSGVECGAVAARLRDAVLARTPDPLPPEVSGHGVNGKPHVAYVPLLAAGSARQRGELAGAAVVLPRDAGEWVESVKSALLESSPAPWVPIGPVRTDLIPVSADEAIPQLHAEHWVGPSRVWNSVTPMVLDRFSGKGNESAEITRSCRTLGLPEPDRVQVDRNSWVRGGANLRPRDLPRKDKRPYAHLRVEFPVPVVGPVLLGAQRHLGMGLCQPEPDELAPQPDQNHFAQPFR